MKIHTSLVKKTDKILCWIVVFLFFLHIFSQGLAEGGRWDLYQSVAMADRWGGDFGYSYGAIDYYKPSTPYFPGVTLFSLLLIPLGEYQINSLLFVAAISVIGLFYTLYVVYKKINGLLPLHSFMVFSIAISYYFLSDWLAYAKEFKPDTIALIFFLVGVLSYLKIESKWWKFFSLCVAFATSLCFKQQIIAPQIVFLLIILFYDISVKDKILNLIFGFMGIFLGLFAVYIIDGGYFYAIESHIGRSRVSINDSGHIKLMYQLCFLIVLNLIIRGVSSTLFFDRFRQTMFITFPAGIWLVACIAGALNFGGNIGNTAVGIVLFIPLIAITFDKYRDKLPLILTFLMMIVLLKDLTESNWYNRYLTRINLDSEISAILSVKKPNSILISGDSYLSVRGFGVQRISEIDTWAHIKLGVNKKMASINGDELIKELMPDLIICVQGCSVFDQFYSFSPEKNGYKEVSLNSVGRVGVLFEKVTK